MANGGQVPDTWVPFQLNVLPLKLISFLSKTFIEPFINHK